MTDFKFLAYLVAVVLATCLRLLGADAGLTGAEWVSTTTAALYAYVVGGIGAVVADGYRLVQQQKAQRAEGKGGG